LYPIQGWTQCQGLGIWASWREGLQTAGNAPPLSGAAFSGLSWLFRSFKLRLSVVSYKSLFRPPCPPPFPFDLSTASPLCQKYHDYGDHAVNSTCNSRPLCVYLVRPLLRLHPRAFISSPCRHRRCHILPPTTRVKDLLERHILAARSSPLHRLPVDPKKNPPYWVTL
jgi:hypothetical protein